MPGSRSWLEPLLDLLDFVALEHVLFLEIVEAVEPDAALEALGDFTDVVLEALQARNLAIESDDALAHEAHLRGADDLAFGHVAPCNGDTLDLEDLPNLGLAVVLLDERGRQEAFHGPLHLSQGIVDDRVKAYLDLVLFGQDARLSRGTDVESDDHRSGSNGEIDVA